jgi:ketosteroid isomerase-like protein
MKRFISILMCLVALALFADAQMKKAKAGPAPDKALMQQIWDGWATLNPDNVAQYYAKGPHTFFDIMPLKYSSWEQYYSGSKDVIAGFKSAKFTVNDDVELHRPTGNLVWATATVKDEMTTKDDKVQMGNFRWTVIWENQDGKWLIVHEHISAPLQ